MKVKPKTLSKKDKIRYLDALYTATSSLKSRDDMKKFLRDLLTESERIMVGRRIVIASKLLKKESYDDIIFDLKVGADTIFRVHKWLKDEVKGYEKAIEKFEKIVKDREEKFNRKRKEIDDYYMNPFGRLKKRYPLHFLLYNLFDKAKNK
ncbi:MAG: hypothetical protein A3B86_03360 [Candidatus Yanofskybacteria bacterium RIFCSPHIGHO2_02_FULL_38_22b]|uniref:TrpR like protein, YerC/YecD n=1 Tax=Candidatus Yanofskybacteria bacterium RIFCSPHIGHO2_02_FULL_38_22b TaxID=1802673 RepID=A0A1F8F1E2_9BACT|nr:MAG: hypothetical protein A3B86_03360 [Candidatus Yanofskybacteria bacterium RIFCSPHIGHO2_02_FULL_38_22b]OGN19886.1 MAG: hypothetical protein A2910_01935 [Candidatus Yanofskybacteria bacterium RIFCSPLOWO2_01_FULL_39_28]